MSEDTVNGAVESPASVSVVHIASGDVWAGAEVQLYYLVRALNRLPNVEVCVLLLNHGLLEERLRGSQVKVIVIDESKHSSVWIFFEIIALLREIRPEIVHTHRRKENVLGAVACLFIPGANSVRTVHGAEEHIVGRFAIWKRLVRILDQLCGRYLQRYIVAVSRELAEKLNKTFPCSKMIVIENGIDVEEVQRLSQFPVDLPGPEGAVKVAFVGRLVPVKRVDIFLQVAQRIVADCGNRVTFYIFGDGPQLYDVENYCRKAGLRECIFVMRFQWNMVAYLARMDMLVITSDHEGLPMVLLEALTLGVPVIARAVGAIPAVLSRAQFGKLIHGVDVEQYVEAVHDVLHNYGQFESQAHSAVAVIRDQLSIGLSASAYRSLYWNILLRS